jgi:streptogramin lyase
VATIETGGTPAGIAVGDGAVWVADQAGHRVIKIDARTNDIVDRIDVGRPPSAIAFGAKTLWVGVR